MVRKKREQVQKHKLDKKKFTEHYRVSYIQTGDTYDGNYSAT